MQDLVCYKMMPEWNSTTLPAAFKEKHNTQAGTWAKLTIIQGSLDFAVLSETGETLEYFHFSTDKQPPFIEPQQWHRIVSVSDDVVCQLAFYCKPENYCQKKYGFTQTHSEVIAAASLLSKGRVMDLGCGAGRNSLYLQLLGFDVTAFDKSIPNIAQLNKIIAEDELKGISAKVYDINEARLTGTFDFIVSTVVLMFLDAVRIPAIIQNMQQCTNQGGYNLIVSAMSTTDCPCPIPFSFTFKENELKEYYKDWSIIKYNENIGELHKTDGNGQRIKLRFATLLARKR